MTRKLLMTVTIIAIALTPFDRHWYCPCPRLWRRFWRRRFPRRRVWRPRV